MAQRPEYIRLEHDVHGAVKWYNPQKGYGFITPDPDSGLEGDVFLHSSHVDFIPMPTERVTFCLAEDTKRRRKYAVEVYRDT